MGKTLSLPDDYPELLGRLEHEIAGARARAMLAVNAELIGLYWRLGTEILTRQQRENWGSRVTARLSADLREAFPGMRGLSETNLRHMRAFAQAWPAWPICSQLVSKLPWGHNLELVYKLADSATRLWYARNAIEHGWSRKLLEHHIATGRHLREGSAVTNFDRTLPVPEGRLVQQIVHDDYNFEFLGLSGKASESRVERALIADIENFIIELGSGFAFVGRQVPLEVDGEEFFIDLLFFHIPLNRYVVIDLKLGKFRPQYAGQVNFYVNVIDDRVREQHHGSTIGLVLCTSRSRTIARYALNGVDRPVGVARYSSTRALVESLPEQLHDQLPPLEEISAGIQRIVNRRGQELTGLESSSHEPV